MKSRPYVQAGEDRAAARIGRFRLLGKRAAPRPPPGCKRTERQERSGVCRSRLSDS